MNHKFVRVAMAVAAVLAVTVCYSEASTSSRKKEKKEVYASLKPWEKKYIDRGEVAPGFTPDMVYIAMGKADKVDSKDLPEGHVDLWTYTRCYPEPLVIQRYKNEKLSADTAYQPAALQNSVGSATSAMSAGTMVSGNASAAGAGTSGSGIAKTGGPQGGTMEPAAPQSYSIQVLFENGKVSKMSCTPNMNN